MTSHVNSIARPVEDLDAATIRFAGDAGDGMQLAGVQFTQASASAGNDIATFPDYPAEIRAPANSLAGVSGYQVHFSRHRVHTPGDRLDTLVAMNPAALKTNLADVAAGGMVIVNSDAFLPTEYAKAGYENNPLDDGSLGKYRVIPVPITQLNRDAVSAVNLTPKEADRCKNFFALGLVYWLYDRPLETTLKWIQNKFAKNPAVQEANARSLKAGYHFGETTHLFLGHYRVTAAPIAPGRYRRITGTDGLALGLIAAMHQADLPMLFAGYTTPPAGELLSTLTGMQKFGVKVTQAEDETAAVGMALGASFAGSVGVTATSSPGMCLKTEILALGVVSELPLVVIDVQRAGPSVGLPTKTEQGDLLHALFGRPGECPVPVVAASSPADCFSAAFEAVRLAVQYMTPVILLSDGSLACGSEPWSVQSPSDLPKIEVCRPRVHDGVFQPFSRDEKLVRPWAVPGTAGFEHRNGGLEKEHFTGNVSFDPANHELLVQLRARKIADIALDIAEQTLIGPDTGDLLVVGWGSTRGALLTAVQNLQNRGRSVALAHLRHLHPLPRNLGGLLARYKKVLVAELNDGQLAWLLRARYLIDAIAFAKIQGRPFLVQEVEDKMLEILDAEV